MTFSIVAVDRNTGEAGIGVASKFLAVGAVVPWARASAGAGVTQANTNMSQGPLGLDLISRQVPPTDVVEQLLSGDDERDQRQIAFVNLDGNSASWTGDDCLPWAGSRIGDGYACQGNILSGPEVVEAMSKSFEGSDGPFPERLLQALDAGLAAGGDSRGQQSAALYVAKEGGGYGGYLDRYIDLRVDDHTEPLTELRKLLGLHRLTFGSGGRPTLVRLQGNVVKEVQRVLERLGYYEGEINGVNDAATQAALTTYCNVENFEERLAAAHERGPEWFDREVLNHMRGQAH